MTESRGLETPLFDPGHSRRRALALMLPLLALHLWAVWGYVGTFWSDQGVWLHAVERYAQGQVPYRDFDWPSPPLALWVVGGMARVLGTNLLPLMTISSIIAVLVFVAFYRVATRVAAGTALPVVLAGSVFATAYASGYGSTLVLSVGTPTGPLGILCLLGGTALAIELHERATVAIAVGTGVACGLAMLSRHDLWVPALVLAGWAAWASSRGGRSPRAAAALWTAFLATAVLGVAAALLQSGDAALAGLAPARIGDAILRGFPSWERLTIEIAAASALGIAGVVALWLCFALDDTRTAGLGGLLLFLFLSACAVHLGMTIAIAREVADAGPGATPTVLRESVASILRAGRSPMRIALYLLDQRFQLHLFPAILPPLLLAALLVRWRHWPVVRDRDLALLLLALAVALRLRRGLGGTDWYNVLVEIPALALVLHLAATAGGRQAQRAVSMAVTILLVVGCYTYYNLGRGPLTLRRYGQTPTARGVVHWPEDEARLYQEVRTMLDEADPAGRRSLLVFGPAGGWNYFLARDNPTPFTRGFASARDADSVRARVRSMAVPPLVVDNRAMIGIAARWRPSLRSWESVPMALGSAPLQDPAFARIVEGCRELGAVAGPPRIPVYDCAGRGGRDR